MLNCLLALYCSLRLPLEVFHLRSQEAELSVIYAVHYPCHGLSYEPYLEDQIYAVHSPCHGSPYEPYLAN